MDKLACSNDANFTEIMLEQGSLLRIREVVALVPVWCHVRLFSPLQAESIEHEISDLRKSCDAMAEEVTKLTKGTGSSLSFYVLSLWQRCSKIVIKSQY